VTTAKKLRLLEEKIQRFHPAIVAFILHRDYTNELLLKVAAIAKIHKFLLPLPSISLGVPLQAEIIPFEPEQVRTCVGTKMPACENYPFLICIL
jgi:hypothetical protein